MMLHIVFFCIASGLSFAIAAHDDITINNGGYENILVNIEDDIAYNKNKWENLQDYFVEASEVLYKATKHNYDIGHSNSLRYFKDVTFFLPTSWKGQTPIQCGEAGTLNRNDADFEVVKNTKQWDGIPHTVKQHSQCGTEQPNPIQIPQRFIQSRGWARNVFGDNLGKVLVHEWAIYRYGLHEESTAKDGESNCETVEMPDGKMADFKIRCSRSIDGKVIGGNKNKPCDFRHDSSSSPNAIASLMFWGPKFLDQTDTFCDDTNIIGMEHDFDANHNHNLYCDVKTGWEVLREHRDFSDSISGPEYDQDKDFKKDLTFKCVYDAEVNRVVLIMDISGSMGSNSRLTRMRQDVARFLDNLFNAAKDKGEDVEVGMVEFNQNARIICNMTMLRSDEDLQFLKDSIPDRATGTTSIGSGLVEGQKALRMSGGTTVGSKMYVFTDGYENASPRINDVSDEIADDQTIVYGLLIDTQSSQHDLIKLSEATNGAWCVYSDDDGGIGYYECLNDIHALTSRHVPQEIKTAGYRVASNSDVEDMVQVDSSFNEHVRFTLTWSSRFSEHVVADPALRTSCDNIDLQVTSPEGRIIGSGDPGYEKNSHFHLIYISSRENKPGTWHYKILNPSSQTCSTRLTVEGFSSRNASYDDIDMPLIMESHTSSTHLQFDQDGGPIDNSVRLYVTLTKGHAPVLGAEITVHIFAGRGVEWHLSLHDNGAGADLKKDDGIYSCFFFEFATNGVYSPKFFAKGIDGKTKIKIEQRQVENDYLGFVVSKNEELLPYEDFERSLVGTPFEVTDVPNNIDDIEKLLPPAKIADLSVISVSNVSIILRWTAVGQSLDSGIADRYELRAAISSLQLRNDFDGSAKITDDDLNDGTLVSPHPSGEIETITIDPKSFDVILNGTFMLAIKAVDSHGNFGEMSNIVVVHYSIEESIQPPAPTAAPSVGPTASPPRGDYKAWVYITVVFGTSTVCVAVMGTILLGSRKRTQVYPAVV